MFGYVFGSSIEAPGGISYREFLIAGVFAQTVIFGATGTGAGVAFGNLGQIGVTEPWPMAHPFAYSLIWIGIILAVFVPLSIREYKKASTR